MRRLLAHSAIVVFVAGTLSAATAQQAPPESAPLVVRAARFLTMAGPPIDDGAMVVQGGKIIAIGRADQLELPANAEQLDLGERIVTPGFVDLHHHVSSAGGDINDMVAPINAEMRTLDVVRPTAAMIRDTVEGGVTTTLFIPGSGTNISGFGTLLKMVPGAKLEELVIRELGAMKVAQGYNPERRAGDIGGTRMGMHDLMTRALLRGQAYAKSWRDHAAGQGPKPEFRADLEQLRKVFDLEVPVIIHTAGARDCVATARMFQDVFQVRMILSHGTFDGHWAATALAARKTPVNLGPRTFHRTRDGRIQGIAAGYYEAGCTDLSINTDAPVIPAEQLSLQAAMAARLGLPWRAALEALTIRPAQQIGLGDRVGSLEPGKDADFIVTRGDPLDPRFPVEQAWIEGRLVHSLNNQP